MGEQHLQPNIENQLVALGRALQILREEENADVLIETTLEYLQSEFNYRLVWIGLYDRLDHQLFGKGGTTPNGDTAFLHQRFNLNPGDLLEQVVIQQRPIGVSDLRQETRMGDWRRIAQECDIQGTLLFPLRSKDRCFGVALLGSHLWGVSPRPAEKAQLSLLLGGLAAALYQIEAEWQRSSTKRPDQSLFQVLDELIQVPTLDQRLDSIVTMTQNFVAPTRTNLYWYSPERRYFWHRVGNRQLMRRFGDQRTNAAGLTVAEASDFYHALVSGQLVTIGAGRSLLRAESTERLLKRLRIRSLLAAPIQAQGELLGFLAAEDNEPRIWEDVEKNYVRAMAQLVTLVTEPQEVEATLELTAKDAEFTAEITQAITQRSDTTAALKDCAGLLCKRFDTDRVLVLQEDVRGQFTVLFQQHPSNRRPLSTLLPPLVPYDRQMLLGSTEALMIEDLEEDLRLVQWRDTLMQLGVRSALLVALKRSPLGRQMAQLENTEPLSLLILSYGMPRTWKQTDRALVSKVAQQINGLLELDRLQEGASIAFHQYQLLQTGLSTLTQAPLDPSQLERTWVDYLATQLDCPLVALIGWTPETDIATIVAMVSTDPRFALPSDLTIPILSDTLIQEALVTTGFLCRSIASVDASVRTWLSSPSIGQLLVIGLHTGATPTTGILLLGDREERQWPHHLFPSLETLIQQFAWFRYYQHYVIQHEEQGATLQSLNWYKHRCLEMLHQSVRESISAMLSLEAKTSLLAKEELNSSNLTETGDNNSESSLVEGEGDHYSTNPSLRRMHRQQLLRHLEQTLTGLTPVIQEEQWQLTIRQSFVPVVTLLKRSLRRVDLLYNQRQIVLKVHNPGKLSVYGDRLKLECILFEVLTTCGYHAYPGSWVNLWCNPVSPEVQAAINPGLSHPLVELLIIESEVTDEGKQSFDTEPSDLLPNLNLQICQQLLR
ncbi:MAG TPA: GAF domain-containing protein, partial [Coleofasciculaceae cyanobacterium]